MARNNVVKYDSDTAITTTEATDIFGATKADTEFSMIRVWNETDKDITLRFGSGEGNKFLAKSGDNVSQPFYCTGKVALSAPASSTGNLFIQLTDG